MINYSLLILQKMLTFLILLSLGYIIVKIGVIKRESMSSIASFILNVILPCLTASLFIKQKTTFQSIVNYFPILIYMVCVYIIMLSLGFAGSWLTHNSRETANLQIGCSMSGNFSFVVIPIAMSILGESIQSFIPLASAIDTAVVWTLGISMFTRGVDSDSKIIIKLRYLFNPVFTAVLVSILINSLSISIPTIFMTVISQIGEMCYSLGFLYVGCSLFFKPHYKTLHIPSLIILITGKLLVAPALVFTLFSRFLPTDTCIFLMLVAGAPIMSTSCSISKKYNLNEGFATEAVSISTICCLFTIPLLLILFFLMQEVFLNRH